MDTRKFLDSIRPLLARGKSAAALEEIDAYGAAQKQFRDCPFGQEDEELLTRVKLEILSGRRPDW